MTTATHAEILATFKTASPQQLRAHIQQLKTDEIAAIESPDPTAYRECQQLRRTLEARLQEFVA